MIRSAGRSVGRGKGRGGGRGKGRGREGVYGGSVGRECRGGICMDG